MLVVKVVEKFHARMVHFPNDVKPFARRGQEILRIFLRIDIFQQDIDFGPLGDFRSSLQSFHAALMLVFTAQITNAITGKDYQ